MVTQLLLAWKKLSSKQHMTTPSSPALLVERYFENGRKAIMLSWEDVKGLRKGGVKNTMMGTYAHRDLFVIGFGKVRINVGGLVGDSTALGVYVGGRGSCVNV
jgi:hypothetical protein